LTYKAHQLMGWMLQYVDFYRRLKLSLQMSSCHRIVLCQVTFLCWQLQAKVPDRRTGNREGPSAIQYHSTTRSRRLADHRCCRDVTLETVRQCSDRM